MERGAAGTFGARLRRLTAAGRLAACLLAGAPGPRALAQTVPGCGAKAAAPAVPAVPALMPQLGAPVAAPSPGLTGPPAAGRGAPVGLALPAPAVQPPAEAAVPPAALPAALQPAPAVETPQGVQPAQAGSWAGPALRVARELVAELAARRRMKRILSAGGAIPAEDRPFVELWFPRLFAKGLIGRPPTGTELLAYAAYFPRLLEMRDWRISGDECAGYNCVAWSVGAASSVLEPERTWEGHDSFYRERGYLPYEGADPGLSADVMLWADRKGLPIHASRRVAGPWWESKLGPSHRIIHWLAHLEGGAYGKPFRAYYRAR